MNRSSDGTEFFAMPGPSSSDSLLAVITRFAAGSNMRTVDGAALEKQIRQCENGKTSCRVGGRSQP